MNRFNLTDEVRKKYKPMIQEFLNKMENLTSDEIEYMENKEFCLELSDTGLNPQTLLKIMKELGYGNEKYDNNGWQLDFWIRIRKNGVSYTSSCEEMCIFGCGMTFELKLFVNEFM